MARPRNGLSAVPQQSRTSGMRIFGEKRGVVVTAPQPTIQQRAVDDSIPAAVNIAGQFAWRILAVVGVLVVLGLLVANLEEIVIPFFIAILISGLLTPLVNVLRRHRWPHWLAIVVALVGLLIVVSGLIFLVVSQVRSGLPNLEKQSTKSFAGFKEFLRTSPLHVTDSQFNSYIGDGLKTIQKYSSSIAAGALSVGKVGISLVTGTLLVLFSTIFLLIDGAGVWAWVVRLFPRKARVAVDGAGKAGWLTLTTFVRVQVFVAAVDAVGVGLFAFFLGLPLAIPIAIIVFLASFIPVVGAIATGIIAVLVALVYVGPIQALIMLGGVLVVHLLEAHVLQPLVMGSAVKVHPLAVVLSVAGGSYIAGIPGALFAVPTVAVINVMVVYVASGKWRELSKSNAEHQAADEVTPGA
jgi:predicted PurR-regulated permease PerM